MTWIAPLAIPMPKQPEPEVPGVYVGKVNTGGHGTPVTYRGETYPSIRAAANANMMTVAAMRWSLLHKRTK